MFKLDKQVAERGIENASLWFSQGVVGLGWFGNPETTKIGDYLSKLFIVEIQRTDDYRYLLTHLTSPNAIMFNAMKALISGIPYPRGITIRSNNPS